MYGGCNVLSWGSARARPGDGSTYCAVKRSFRPRCEVLIESRGMKRAEAIRSVGGRGGGRVWNVDIDVVEGGSSGSAWDRIGVAMMDEIEGGEDVLRSKMRHLAILQRRPNLSESIDGREERRSTLRIIASQ